MQEIWFLFDVKSVYGKIRLFFGELLIFSQWHEALTVWSRGGFDA